jgi:acetyltransferase-like isoleucine patch superfamily enzyme
MGLLEKGKILMTKYPKIISLMLFMHNKFLGFNSIKKSGIGNKITGIRYSIIRHTKININGANNIIEFSDKNYFKNSKIYIYGNNNKVSFGEDVISIDGEFWLEDDGNTVKIGNGTTIYGRTHIAATEGKTVEIGNDCMFSADIFIRTGDSHSIIDQNNKRINEARDVIIHDHVWFGNKTTILKGANIQSNTVLGTGAVLTKPCDQSNVILAGNPARVIKNDINWLRERI